MTMRAAPSFLCLPQCLAVSNDQIRAAIYCRCALGICLSIALCFSLFSGGAEAAQWSRTYGGPYGDWANSVRQTADGGFVVAGKTSSFSAVSEDAWVLKLDANGNVVWQKTYGGAGSNSANSVQPTADGGYIVAGQANPYWLGQGDLWILKLDANGNIAWQKTYGGGANGGSASSVQLTSDGGYIVAGYTVSFGAGGQDAWLLKLDADGNVIWQRTYGGSLSDGAMSAEPTADGGYIVAGWTASFGAGSEDVWVLKLDRDGNIIWQKTYGDTGQDVALSVQPTGDGGYIVAGAAANHGGWVLKLDANGNVDWQKTYGGSTNSIQPTADGGYVVAGGIGGSALDIGDAWILKLDTGGNITWQRTYRVSAGSAASVQSTADGGYVVAGITSPSQLEPVDAWILKLDANGAISGCANAGTSNVTPAYSNAIPTASAAIVASSTAVPVSGVATVGTSTAVSIQQCYYAAPTATDVPTLSEWGRIMLGLLLGASASVALRRRTSS
jgi:hypothetical protein